VSFNIKF